MQNYIFHENVVFKSKHNLIARVISPFAGVSRLLINEIAATFVMVVIKQLLLTTKILQPVFFDYCETLRCRM